MTAPAETPVAPITEKDLEGLPPRAMVALAARAAWRVVPAVHGIDPTVLGNVGAALAAASLHALGMTLPVAAALTASEAVDVDASREDMTRDAMRAVRWVAEAAAQDLTAYGLPEQEQKLAARTGRNVAQAATVSLQAACQIMPPQSLQVIQGDLEWLRQWAAQKRAADGIVGPDFFQRPLWLRPDGDAPPDEWLRIIDDWTKTTYSAGLDWLVEQYERLLKGGGLDVERQQAFLSDWYKEHQPADSEEVVDDAGKSSIKQTKIGVASKNKDFFGTLGDTEQAVHPAHEAEQAQVPEEGQAEAHGDAAGKKASVGTMGDTAQKAPPDQEAGQARVPEETRAAPLGAGPYEPGPEPEPTELLPTGIVTASADIPATEDHLGRTPLVETLADMLASPQQSLPMTIALLGDWGAGKSSVIAQLRKRLDELALKDRLRAAAGDKHRYNQYRYAEFNAWEYEQTKSLRAGLAQEVVNGLTADLAWWSRRWLALNKARKGNSWEFWSTVGGLLLSVVGLWLGFELATPKNADTADVLSGGGVAAVSGYLLFQTWRTGRRLLEHPLTTQLFTYLKLPSYGEHLGEVPVIKKDISELCTERLGEITNGRLLVVVDDLDRCHPNAVIETLDAIRLVMNLQNVAVILAIDDRIAFRAVADHYKALAEDGKRSKEEIARDYLGKIIQLPVNLYKPWPQEVGDFIHDHLFKVEGEKPADDGSRQEDAKIEQREAVQVVPEVDATPEARELAAQHGIPLAPIQGSGKNGRVLKRDVEAEVDAMAAWEPAEQQEVGDVAPQAEARAGEAVTPIAAGSAEEQPAGAAEYQDFSEAKEQEESHALERVELMKDTAFERDLFVELAREMDFHNPRQLIRLRNSYRLLKGYRHSREKKPVDTRWVEFLMHGLFWYEFLYQQKLSDRQLAELVAWEWSGKDWEEIAKQKDEETEAKRKTLEAAGDKRAEQLANPPVVNMSRRLNGLLPGDKWADGYPGLMQTVEMVVLPNAQMGLLLKRHDVDEVLYGKSTALEGAKLDPWNLALAKPERTRSSENNNSSSD